MSGYARGVGLELTYDFRGSRQSQHNPKHRLRTQTCTVEWSHYLNTTLLDRSHGPFSTLIVPRGTDIQLSSHFVYCGIRVAASLDTKHQKQVVN
jgi:hypothetical protein